MCAFEFMSGPYVRTACELTGATVPVQTEGAWHVLIEAAGAAGQCLEEPLQEALMQALEGGDIDDCAMAASQAHRESFWRIREAIPEVLTHLKPPATLDIGLPWARTAEYVQKVDAELQARLPQAQHLFLGHLGDYNLHLISGPLDEAGVHAVDEIAYGALRGCGGTVSAEHGGEVSFALVGAPPVLPHIGSGKLVGYAVTQPERSPLAPQVPTLAEALDLKQKDDFVSWYGLLTPAQVPAEAVQALSRAAFAVLQRSNTRARLAALGTDLVAMPAAPFAQRMQQETRRYGEVIQRLGIKAS